MQSFSIHSHTGSIRSVTANEKFIASGGADDRICVYDVERRKEIDDLYVHDGTINSLSFVPDGSFLISGGADGKIGFTKTTTWKLEKVLERAHKGLAINHISVHPSGKLALSVGADQTLRTWNLITGRQAHATSLKNKDSLGGSIEIVEWSETGEYFAIVGKDTVEIWHTESGEVIRTKKCESKPTSLCWISDEDIFVGLESGKLLFFNLEDEEDEETLCEIYDKRVKAMFYKYGYLVTASSSGELNLWEIIRGDRVEIDMLCGIDVGCRIICLDLIKLPESSTEFEVKQEQEEQLKKTQVKKLKTTGSVTVETEESPSKTTKNKKKEKKRKSGSDFLEVSKSASKKKRKSFMPEFVEEDA